MAKSHLDYWLDLFTVLVFMCSWKLLLQLFISGNVLCICVYFWKKKLICLFWDFSEKNVKSNQREEKLLSWAVIFKNQISNNTLYTSTFLCEKIIVIFYAQKSIRKIEGKNTKNKSSTKKQEKENHGQILSNISNSNWLHGSSVD